MITGRAGMAFAGTKTLILGSGGTSKTARHVVEAAGGEAVTVSRTVSYTHLVQDMRTGGGFMPGKGVS